MPKKTVKEAEVFRMVDGDVVVLRGDVSGFAQVETKPKGKWLGEVLVVDTDIKTKTLREWLTNAQDILEDRKYHKLKSRLDQLKALLD